MKHTLLTSIAALACAIGIIACAGGDESSAPLDDNGSIFHKTARTAKIHNIGDHISIIDEVSVNETGEISLQRAQWVEFYSDGSEVDQARLEGAHLYRLVCLTMLCRIGNSDALENDGVVLEGRIAYWRLSPDQALRLEGYAVRTFWRDATPELAKKAVDSELNLFNNAPLLWSIEVGRTEVIRILVDSGMIFDDTALHLAMDQGSSGLEPLSILLGSGGTADAIHAGQTLLDRAIGSQPDFIPTLLEHGATPTLESLELAIEHQRDTLIVDFLDRGVTVSPRSLSLAVQRGDRAEILVADLLHHIDPNETALGDDPVLLLAIKSRQEDLVGLLVASGAIVDPDYLLVAVSQGDAAAEILRTLLYGLPENDRPPTDNLLVYRAIRNRSDNVLDILLEHGSPIGTQSFDEALNQDDVALVSRLLDAGAAPSPNSLATSIRRPNAEMLKVLLEFGASIRPTDLSLAIDRGNQPAIDLLLSHGAAIGAQDVRTAIEMKDHGLIKTLIDHGAPITHGTLKFAIETQDTNVIVALLEAEPMYPHLRQMKLKACWILHYALVRKWRRSC